jgi:anion-transporting  ArsA/GET3 family ATPase
MTTLTLEELVQDAPLVILLGPGGVGKTTVSSVMALHKAAEGNRSLVLTIDPARRLADALGISKLTNDPVEVQSFRKMHPSGRLSALMLDPKATFDQMISMLVSDPERREALLCNRFYQYLSRGLAGTLEYMAVERLHTLSKSGDYDSIVLDTPPTTNAVDFLDAPGRLAEFFSTNVTRWFLPSEKQASKSWTKKIFNQAGSSALSLISRLAGETFADETSQFFQLFADLLGSFRARGLEVGKILRDSDTVFLIVCSPDPNRLSEAKAIDRHLRESGSKASGFIVNRVDEAFLPEQEELARAVQKAGSLLGGAGEMERVGFFVERLEKLRQTRQSLSSLHAQAVEDLRAYASPRPVYSAPRVPAGQSPRASLLALYVGLFAENAEPFDSAAKQASETRGAPRPGRRATDLRSSEPEED